jgi:hypothetical protein
MKRPVCAALVALLTLANVASAEEVRPLDTTSSSQATSLPILENIPRGALIVGAFVILAGVIIGLAGDSTDGT